MSAGGKYTSNSPESTTISIKPDAFNVGELDSGAHPTSTSVMTIPIPTGSSVVDMQVTFRDRRPDYDDESRTGEPIIVTRLELGSTIAGWTSSDFTFAGRIWRRHERDFSLNGVTYTFRIYASFDPENFYLMFQGFHFGRSNTYGGWENLTVNYSEFQETSTAEEIEVEQLVGYYLPTQTEMESELLETGIDMSQPNTYVRLRTVTNSAANAGLFHAAGSSIVIVRPSLINNSLGNTLFYSDDSNNLKTADIFISDPENGIIQNIFLGVSQQVPLIEYVEVFVRKKINILAL